MMKRWTFAEVFVYEPGKFLDFNGRGLHSHKQPHIEID